MASIELTSTVVDGGFDDDDESALIKTTFHMKVIEHTHTHAAQTHGNCFRPKIPNHDFNFNSTTNTHTHTRRDKLSLDVTQPELLCVCAKE